MPAGPIAYSERLLVPVRWWAYGALFVLAVWWAFYVATPAWVSVLGAVVAAMLVGVLLGSYGAVLLRVERDGFRAGRAFLTWPHVGAVEVVEPVAVRRLLTVEADARAFLVLRTYCRGAVRIWLQDPDDPAPYWLVSTRRPRRLQASLVEHGVQN